jgi:heterodisulfide reductase subunit B
MLDLAFYPGCLVLQRMPEYEAATRAVLKRLGVELHIVQQPVCCGSPVIESFSADWLYPAAYNLARVEAMGLDEVLAVCGGCANTLTRAALALRAHDVRADVNRRLASQGLVINSDVIVKHLIRVLIEREDVLRATMTRQFSFRIALTNPCQAFRPGKVMNCETPMAPRDVRRLVALTGAEVVTYGGEDECCGATLYLADRGLALAAGRHKLEAAAGEGADLLLHGCGNCQLLLRRFQKMIVQKDAHLRIRALLLPQLLGLAMGIPEAELGLREGMLV